MPHDLLRPGRRLSAPELAPIQHWLAAHPAWHRTRLSRELCALWDWRNAAGQLKDMACRSLLLQLQARGLITLPPRQRASVNATRYLHGAVTRLGDDRYAHQPFCRRALLHGFHCLFVCKPESHATLYQWVNLLPPGPDRGTYQERLKVGSPWHTYTYRWAHRVPRAEGDDAVKVNWCARPCPAARPSSNMSAL